MAQLDLGLQLDIERPPSFVSEILRPKTGTLIQQRNSLHWEFSFQTTVGPGMSSQHIRSIVIGHC